MDGGMKEEDMVTSNGNMTTPLGEMKIFAEGSYIYHHLSINAD